MGKARNYIMTKEAKTKMSNKAKKQWESGQLPQAQESKRNRAQARSRSLRERFIGQHKKLPEEDITLWMQFLGEESK
jgi:hypothetical protein